YETAPRTKLAAFEFATDSVIIKARSGMGLVRGVNRDAVRVEYDIFTNVTSGQKEYGVSLLVVPETSTEKHYRYYVDYEDIDSLLKGIDYITRMNPAVSDLVTFEAEYRSKGDLEISTFTDIHGAVRVAISNYVCGSNRTALDLAGLSEIQRLLVAAKSKLDSIKSGQ
ncbi:MAG: hypothetical protein ACREDR_24600, partial [Blastocatellia bacterium]